MYMYIYVIRWPRHCCIVSDKGFAHVSMNWLSLLSLFAPKYKCARLETVEKTTEYKVIKQSVNSETAI